MNKAIWTFLLLALVLESSAEARPRFYVEVRGVKEPANTKPSFKDKAKAILEAELKKHPKVTTTLGDPPPKGKALSRILKAKRLRGYGIILRITKVDHSINPPPKGKFYRILMVEVAVAIDAEKIPTGQMALAGTGTAGVGTEISRYKEKERVQLTHEAITKAVEEAVGRSVKKLAGEKKSRRRRGKRRRR